MAHRRDPSAESTGGSTLLTPPGYPRCQMLLRAYLQEMARTDIPRLGRTRHEPQGVLRLMVSLSRNIATTAGATTLSADIAGDGAPSRKTVADYLSALRRVFVVEDVLAWPLTNRESALAIPRSGAGW